MSTTEYMNKIKTSKPLKTWWVIILVFISFNIVDCSDRASREWICEQSAPCLSVLRPKGSLIRLPYDQKSYEMEITVKRRQSDERNIDQIQDSVYFKTSWSVSVNWYRLLETKVRVPLVNCKNQFECSVHLMNSNDIQPSGDRNPAYVYRHFLIETNYEGHPSKTKVEIVIGKALQAQDNIEKQAGSLNVKQNDLYSSEKWSEDANKYPKKDPSMMDINRNLIDSANIWPDNSYKTQQDASEKSSHRNSDMLDIHNADQVIPKKNSPGVSYKIPSTDIYSNIDKVDYVDYEEYGMMSLEESSQDEKRKFSGILEKIGVAGAVAILLAILFAVAILIFLIYTKCCKTRRKRRQLKKQFQNIFKNPWSKLKSCCYHEEEDTDVIKVKYSQLNEDENDSDDLLYPMPSGQPYKKFLKKNLNKYFRDSKDVPGTSHSIHPSANSSKNSKYWKKLGRRLWRGICKTATTSYNLLLKAVIAVYNFFRKCCESKNYDEFDDPANHPKDDKPNDDQQKFNKPKDDYNNEKSDEEDPLFEIPRVKLCRSTPICGQRFGYEPAENFNIPKLSAKCDEEVALCGVRRTTPFKAKPYRLAPSTSPTSLINSQFKALTPLQLVGSNQTDLDLQPNCLTEYQTSTVESSLEEVVVECKNNFDEPSTIPKTVIEPFYSTSLTNISTASIDSKEFSKLRLGNQLGTNESNQNNTNHKPCRRRNEGLNAPVSSCGLHCLQHHDEASQSSSSLWRGLTQHRTNYPRIGDGASPSTSFTSISSYSLSSARHLNLMRKQRGLSLGDAPNSSSILPPLILPGKAVRKFPHKDIKPRRSTNILEERSLKSMKQKAAVTDAEGNLSLPDESRMEYFDNPNVSNHKKAIRYPLRKLKQHKQQLIIGKKRFDDSRESKKTKVENKNQQTTKSALNCGAKLSGSKTETDRLQNLSNEQLGEDFQPTTSMQASNEMTIRQHLESETRAFFSSDEHEDTYTSDDRNFW